MKVCIKVAYGDVSEKELYIDVQRGTYIKGLKWPPLEPKTENCFSQISLIGLVEE